MKHRAIRLPIAAALLLCFPGAVPRGDAGTPLDRYRVLIEQKMALQRENRSLERETELAKSRSPYILFDVHRKVLSFRVRGKTFKEYHVKTISSRGRGRRPISGEALWRLHDGPLTVFEKEGGRQEIVPPGAEDEAGLDEEFHGGEVSRQDDAATLGVQAPEDYFIKFEEDVIFHVQTDRRLPLGEKALERAGEFMDALRGLWRSASPDDPLVVYLLIDAETAAHLYHSILPGERFYISPPPPTVTLIDSQP